ncbi:polyprotein [Rhynchospora pubera]|uniref:Polyprotein n=1 Tax=Rhynchospora pubera TaxID=906938 RepID=A0AAV8CL90_9POAL|nr:polyprotein [Rhynchospora pubera]
MTSTRAGSAVMDEMKTQISQLQTEIEKVAKDGADRSSKEISQLREQIAEAMKEQSELFHRGVDERMGRLEEMFDRVLRRDNELPNGSNLMGNGVVGNNQVGNGVLGARPSINPDQVLRRNPESSDYRFNESVSNGDGFRRDQTGNRSLIPQIQLPRTEFPVFDGSDPADWLMKSQYYFDMYQIPLEFKTRLAVLSFSGEASAWYAHFRLSMDNPPWEIFVEEVFARFTENVAQELVGEFKRLQQSGKVTDYIRQFDSLRGKLMHERPYLPVDFYVSAFVEGLREEVRAMVTMFGPKNLNEAYKYAKQSEQFQEGQIKRLKATPKPQNTFTYPRTRVPDDKRPTSYNNGQRNWPGNNDTRNLTYEQKRAMGLCTRCEAKWHPGHQCTIKSVHVLMGPDDNSDEQEDEPVILHDEEDSSDLNDKVEETVISLFAARDPSRVRNMKFKGFVGSTPVCALVDSGSTHSFVNPDVVHSKSFKIAKTAPMAVVVANGNKMLTDAECKGLKFSIQGKEFIKDMRLLNIKGYDIILGLDWLTERGPMLVDWKKGCLKFNDGNQEINLQVCEESTEVALCNSLIDLNLEGKKGNEVLIAQLFRVEEALIETKLVAKELLPLIDKYQHLFEEPKSLPPHRKVDHQIQLTDETNPINLRPYRQSYFQKLEVEKIIEELLKNGFIQPSTSPFASPVILVKKKDNSWRLCVDYRKLNSCTVKNRFPIPMIEDLLDELHVRDMS